MAHIAFQKDIPVVREVDVLVIGGGPSGIAAAIAAARNGARTLLVERYGFLGGSATASLVGPFMTSFSKDGKIQLVRGIFDELVRKMVEIDGALHPAEVEAGSAYSGYIVEGHARVTPFHPEGLKFVAAEMCLDAGVELYLHTTFVEPLVEVEGGTKKVAGAIVTNKSGLQALKARMVVDCSADADVAYRAGVPTQKGRSQDGLMQPMTLFCRLGNVDREKVEAYRRTRPADEPLFAAIVEEAKARGEFPIPRDKVGVYMESDGKTWRVNTTRVLGVDGTKVEDLTRAEIEGRRQIFALLKFLRAYCPGFEECTLLETAAQIGVRETRRIVGEYTLTLEDLATGRAFDDVIALAGYPVDIHDPTGSKSGFDHGYKTADIYQIPYRSLVPLEVENLVVAGRILSATHEAAAAVRVMPPCFAMGQAAGTAAALALQASVPLRQLDVKQLQRTLVSQGAYLGDIEA